MADPPDIDDDDAPDDPQSRFLTVLWTHLDAASAIAIAHDVMSRLDSVIEHLEAAADTIRLWRAGRFR